MWTTEHAETTSASPASVWSLWRDVASWPEWDEEVAAVELEGPFRAGSSGRLTPRGGPRVAFTLTDVREGAGFADESRLPLAVLRFEHRLERDGARTRITHAVSLSGPATPLFARLLGRKLRRGLPGAVRRLAELAEAREGAVALPG